MLFTNFNVEAKTLRIISLIITLIGIIFILASAYVGNFAIRTAMLVIFMLSIFNFKASYHFSSKAEKMNMLFGMAGTILVFIKPSLTMFIIGVAIMVLSVPVLYKAVKNKDYSDKIMIAVSSIGTLFAVYCILNSRSALHTVITIIGIGFVILGCLMLFETFNLKRKSNKYAIYEQEEVHEYRFEDAEK